MKTTEDILKFIEDKNNKLEQWRQDNIDKPEWGRYKHLYDLLTNEYNDLTDYIHNEKRPPCL